MQIKIKGMAGVFRKDTLISKRQQEIVAQQKTDDSHSFFFLSNYMKYLILPLLLFSFQSFSQYVPVKIETVTSMLDDLDSCQMLRAEYADKFNFQDSVNKKLNAKYERDSTANVSSEKSDRLEENEKDKAIMNKSAAKKKQKNVFVEVLLAIGLMMSLLHSNSE